MDVNLGYSKLKKSFFPNSFDSSTSLNFGECVPQFCKHVAPDTHVNLSVRSGVRLAPLSLPTFGKAYLKSYYFYNRISDIYPPFDNLLTRTPFTGGSKMYVPSGVPSVPLSFLWAMVLSNSTVSYYKMDSSSGSILTEGPLSYNSFNFTPIDFSDLNGLIPTGSFDPLLDILFSQRNFISSSFYNDFQHLGSWEGRYPFGKNCNIAKDKSDPSFTFVEPGSADFLLTGLSFSKVPYLDPSNGALDFVNLSTDFPNQQYAIAIRLNDSGKLLRKILLGLGYKIGNYTTKVSILPLIAFYYNYFDTFAPKRFVQRISTAAYQLMNLCIQDDLSFENSFYFTYHPGGHINPLGSEFVDDLCGCFYTEDTDYYTSQILGQINNFGNSIDQPYLGADYNSDSVGVYNIYQSVSDGVSPSIHFVGDEGVSPGDTDSNLHQQSQQNVLSRLTEFLNIRSLVGGEIAETLKSVYGIDVKDVLDVHRTYVGSSSVDVEFSDVFSTAETQQGYLGEYAGKAIGFGENGDLNFDCPVEGFVICFATVVPRTQYVDGVDPCLFHVAPEDFYNPKFDGLTLLPTRALSFYAHDTQYYGINNDNVDNHSFGNAPIYLEYKTRSQGVLNGDLSLKSTQSSYDSFTMDRCIANEPYSVIENPSSGVYSVEFVDANINNLTAGTSWRYLGRWLWYGRFDRIFINAREVFATYNKSNWESFFNAFLARQSVRTDDNLVVHNIVDLKLNSAMLPVADSYMTKDLYELENGNGNRAKIQ